MTNTGQAGNIEEKASANAPSTDESPSVVEPPRVPVQARPQAAVSPALATLLGWAAVAIWNVGDITSMPAQPNGLGARAAHYAVDLGHWVAVALPIVLGVWLWTRFGRRGLLWSTLAVAVASAAWGTVVLAPDLAGALERWFPDVESPWLLRCTSMAVAQLVTACFFVGRLAARPRLRWVAVALGGALLVTHAFVLESGYPGAHVLISASGATLIAAALSGSVSRWAFPRLAGRRWSRAAPVALMALAAVFAVVVIARKPSSTVQVELLQRNTTLLFPWIRSSYERSKVGAVEIPRELRPWFASRVARADLLPPAKRLLPERPIVILITIDALRADLMQPRYRHVAPNLHAIKERSVYFSQARTSSSDTLFSLATLFTGRHNFMLNWKFSKGRRKSTLQEEPLPRLGELLSKRGVQTLLAPSVTMMGPERGLARGFTEELPLTEDEKYRSLSAEIAEAFIARLRRHGGEPLFFYTHMMEPHDPYDTYGKPAATKFDAYLVEVSVADEELGRIRRAIDELGLTERTAFIVAADHGEGFGEHRIFTHARALYDVLAHVPLMLEIPGVKPRTVDDFVMLMDLAPTVLDLFGVPTPGHWIAESLTPYLMGGRGDPSRVLFMERYGHKVMLFPDGLKLMRRGDAYEVYDVRRDPEENTNLWERLGDEGPRREALLEAYLEAHSNAKRSDIDVSEADRASLRWAE